MLRSYLVNLRPVTPSRTSRAASQTSKPPLPRPKNMNHIRPAAVGNCLPRNAKPTRRPMPTNTPRIMRSNDFIRANRLNDQAVRELNRAIPTCSTLNARVLCAPTLLNEHRKGDTHRLCQQPKTRLSASAARAAWPDDVGVAARECT